MKIHPIELAFNKLNDSIKNTAKYYPEGRNILIRCLSRNSNRTSGEVIDWLLRNKIDIFDIENYLINDTD